MEILIILFFIIVIFIVVAAFTASSRKEKEEERRKQIKEERIKTTEETKEANEVYTKKVETILSSIDKVISICTKRWDIPIEDLSKAFFVSMKGQSIYFNDGVVLHFSDIVECSIIDNSVVISTSSGQSVSNTKTSGGNMIGRAVVGGLVAGGAGAVIGGATASKNTITNTNSKTRSYTKHDYTIIICTKDVLNSLHKISCGNNEEAAYEIYTTIQAIINNNHS